MGKIKKGITKAAAAALLCGTVLFATGTTCQAAGETYDTAMEAAYVDKSGRGIFKGKTIFWLTYQWNDIIDPNFQYTTDKVKSEFAKIIPFSNPKDYYIHISWSDASVMNFSGKFLAGWLSNDSKENKFKLLPVIL